MLNDFRWNCGETKINIAKQKQIKSLAMIKQAEALPKIEFSFGKSIDETRYKFYLWSEKSITIKGNYSSGFSYLTIAKEYELAGASAISVLTEPDYF